MDTLDYPPRPRIPGQTHSTHVLAIIRWMVFSYLQLVQAGKWNAMREATYEVASTLYHNSVAAERLNGSASLAEGMQRSACRLPSLLTTLGYRLYRPQLMLV